MILVPFAWFAACATQAEGTAVGDKNRADKQSQSGAGSGAGSDDGGSPSSGGTSEPSSGGEAGNGGTDTSEGGAAGETSASGSATMAEGGGGGEPAAGSSGDVGAGGAMAEGGEAAAGAPMAGGEAGSAGDATAGSGGVAAPCGEVDCCPDNPDKDDPGVCGCDKPDDDSDGDGVFDCMDGCPEDEDKTAPGDCGCGYEDTPECAALIAGLVHRYSFNGSGAIAADSVGNADADLRNTSLSGDGVLTLAGTDSDEFVNLPNNIISSLTNATFEAWVTWGGGAQWQRIFDFGSSDAGETAQGQGETYLFLTPLGVGALRVSFTTSGVSNETTLDGASALGTAVSHVAVVVDDTNDTLELYRDGALEGSTAFVEQLSGLDDVNNWLGRSQFTSDDEFGGSIDEFRIYDVALSAAEIQYSYEAGPDAGFFD